MIVMVLIYAWLKNEIENFLIGMNDDGIRYTEKSSID